MNQVVAFVHGRALCLISAALFLLAAHVQAQETAHKALGGTKAMTRIVSADAGATALLNAFGLGQQLVGIDVTSPQPTNGQAIPVVGYHRQLAAEGLLALHPDLLVGSEHMGPPETLTVLKDAGVTVLQLPSVQNGEGLLSNITRLADAVGKPAQAAQVKEQVSARLNNLQQAALPSGTKALFLLSAGSRGLRAAGTGTGGDALIRLLGANNVMTHNSYQPISIEAIMAVNPDLVLVAMDGGQSDTTAFLQSNPALADLSAAKNHRVLGVHSETLVAGLSVLTVDEALRLHMQMKK
ncbi:MAG: ABC transporter substrate-binding protein [Pseudomonadales bacterium]|nr:ABC transporter substrate-binding protein [Pseudomonadales bacterium]